MASLKFVYAALVLSALAAAVAAGTDAEAASTAAAATTSIAVETSTVVVETATTETSTATTNTTEPAGNSTAAANTTETEGLSGTFVKSLIEHRMAPHPEDRNLTSIYLGDNAFNVSGGLFSGYVSYKNLTVCHLDEIRDSITFFISNTTIQGSVHLPRLAVYAEEYQIKDAKLQWPSNQTSLNLTGGPGRLNATFFDLRAELEMIFSKVNETTVELESVDMTPSSGNCSINAEKALVNGEPVDFEKCCSKFNDEFIGVFWARYKEEVLKGMFGRLFHKKFQIDEIAEHLKKFGGQVNYSGV